MLPPTCKHDHKLIVVCSEHNIIGCVFCHPPEKQQMVNENWEPINSILIEAHNIVHGDRQNLYGHPFDNFTKIAKIWTVILDLEEEISAEQVALMMISVKLARMSHSIHKDGWRDIAGYAETGAIVSANTEVIKESKDKD